MLKRKQNLKQEDWLKAINEVKQRLKDKSYIYSVLELARNTADEIRMKTQNKNVAVAWSGGKDSIVLWEIAKKAEIKKVFWVRCNLEYPDMLKWVEENKPGNLIIYNTGQDMNWLIKNQDMIFPQDAVTGAKWFKIVQHTGQEKAYKEHNLDMILLGRRRIDGNYTGKNGVYTNKKGITRYSPLYKWSHEDIFAFLEINKISLPPFYYWDNGFTVGTGPWPARQWTKSVMDGWRIMFGIDKNIVINASKYINSAKKYMEGINEIRKS